MNTARQNYLNHITSLNNLKVPSTPRNIAYIFIVLMGVVFTGLKVTPWRQTAQGWGEVSTIDAENRIQAVSALVTGQIQHWHVTEGQRVKKGDPIVTLADNDKALVERLENQLRATVLQNEANLSAIETAKNNLQRQRELLKQGLVSQRDVEAIEINLEDLRAKAASTSATVSELRVSIARQSIQTKVVPQDGTILRLASSGSATYVNAGDPLAWFIPDGVKRSVVIKVSGLDAPLVKVGREVRLRFEGVPMIQISGWPGTAVGTFGGVVEFVEPVADANGRFSVWVRPNPDEDPWPEENYARLGSRVQGWVLLEEVSLGYELWRQFNNFPPKQPSGGANGN